MKTIQYIKEVSTLEELKKAYKKLAVMYHPDLGGDTAIMQAINNEYDYLFEELKNVHKNQKGEYYTKETDEKPEAWREVMKVNRKITKAKKQMKIICSACFFALFIENTLKRLKAAAMSVFGSGYAWLVADRNGNIGMIITVNQETPLPIDLCPLLNLDVWEHAYFLKHYNDRSSYIDDWFHLINWKQVEARYAMCPFWSSQALESPEQLLL